MNTLNMRSRTTTKAAPLPPAPIPADVDLSRFELPVAITLIKDMLDSDSNPDVSIARLALTTESLRQVPSGSLPADWDQLRVLSGWRGDDASWRKARTSILKGWKRCEPGDRLFKSDVADLVLLIWGFVLINGIEPRAEKELEAVTCEA